jgi:seryl-tRNA synthetase
MAEISVPFTHIDPDSRAQLEYALTFASEYVISYRVNEARSIIEAEVSSVAACGEVRKKITELVRRYEKGEFGLAKTVVFRQERDLRLIDAWSELLQRRWVTPVGQGHVILRGTAARLAELVNRKIDQLFAEPFHAEREYYPATISCKTLDRIHHFTSFPEHVDFVSHLRPDLATINQFSDGCKEAGWSPELHNGRMAENDFAICPSCCYHCYEGMEGWELEPPGRCATMTVACHRYEGANHRTMSRLRAFTQRDVVWVGQPRFVMDARAQAEKRIVQWAKDWELHCTFETANDMFFTEDYAIKASFQRQQQAKKELRLLIPNERQAISVFSSNFHASTFGKAFDIAVSGRPAVSACVGWGIERWVYAIFSQNGLEPDAWPAALKEEFGASRLGLAEAG